MADELLEYLSLCGIGSRSLPGLLPPKGKDPIRPLFSHTLLANLNRELNSSTWTVEQDQVKHQPLWKRASLRGGIMRNEYWAGTEAQLNDTITKFINYGYLRESRGEFGATTLLIEYLLKHAKDFYATLTEEAYHIGWDNGDRRWLEFNEIVFDFFFRGIGPAWRKIRNQVNDAFAQARNAKVHVDTVGSDPSFWVVLNVIGAQVGVNQWDLNALIKRMELQTVAGDPESVLNAVKELNAVKIISVQDEAICLTPPYSELFEAYLSTIRWQLPQLRSDISHWSHSRDNSGPSLA